jgi:hypothetical protein
VAFLADNGYQHLNARARDISEAGIGLILAATLKVGDVVELKFETPGAHAPWEIRAVIRYCHGFQYGFEFLSLTKEQHRQLAKYLKDLPASD